MPLIESGRKAPAFSLKDQEGKTHKLSDYAGKPLVVYFYPKDDTPGCTKETCDFRDRLPQFKKGQAAVVGVSILDEKSKAKFAEKYSLTFPLLADADHAVIDKYGAWQEKSMYGKKYMGILRSAFLIDEKGKIEQAWYKISPKDTPTKLLEALGG